MPEKYTYLLVDFFCILFPFLFSFHPKLRFHRQWNYFVVPCLLTALFFIVWDLLFTIHGIWSFNPGFVLGFYLFHLPLEEYLFFLFIPYACVFTYYCLGLFFNLSAYYIPVSKLTVVFIFLLLFIAATHLPDLYTSVTFILLQLFLSFLVLKKVKWLPLFYFSFFTILFPFFISNGILTGSIIREPVVLYNNNYNLGIRIFTIPIEDTFYGMLLMLMNVAGFEYLKGKGNLKK